ncbi:MAG: sigma-70 family RNA polymerase sigma factor [Propionibacteriaceae bacterium]|jgi:RNA polymerase sigma-70 factor (ECF subfamily)|nr:sigma-70 family RNA polymerase sigma factor [Propionibacteriaceae bacterium]
MQCTQAFVQLYGEQYPRVVAYARRRLGSVADAEDCAAEVFRLAWEHDGTVSVGWLFVTARNLVFAARRSALRVTELSRRIAAEEAANGASEAGSGQNEAALQITEALDTLSGDDRELLIAFYWDGLSGAECAALLGCSTGAVWVRLHRARRCLKAALLAQEASFSHVSSHSLALATTPQGGSL